MSDLETLFAAGNLVALLGWLLLLAGPLLPARLLLVPQLLVPFLIGTAYVALLLANWSGADGGFSTLEDVAHLFESREVLLAAWFHFLAFDLFVGGWIVGDARRAGLRFPLVLPCLPLTFLFGPAGLVLYLAIRWAALRAGAARTA